LAIATAMLARNAMTTAMAPFCSRVKRVVVPRMPA
jgi:hypothetical protein